MPTFVNRLAIILNRTMPQSAQFDERIFPVVYKVVNKSARAVARDLCDTGGLCHFGGEIAFRFFDAFAKGETLERG